MEWLYYGLVGTSTQALFQPEYPWANPDPGFILMQYGRPTDRPTRFGDYIAQADGTWSWATYPDPPFNIVYHEGKLKNLDTMLEISIETLPGNIAARLAALENQQP
ncbi:hypothetical protein [Pseudomonas protegens]|uniref:hypothetical protein n=1 Tax=Pseudomonas protegens TaxID=380021 RepID=UPI001B316249|nr:hypothetical protein [Pseudomonas protegens]MBP5098278.1 hypothetical protein [Pseudomonas protegens]MBP5125477.1 hypothetical protein [Pseudomonas protegens]QTU06164.1 hypothetical protein HUT25_10560 [Pseudomonas protegens]QTU12474.1 hypothetical protein HUT23_11250 [Pseudomonas protegens]QTU40148.1 hypothetical protein HUT24_21055 [Pseudomonas protegens]